MTDEPTPDELARIQLYGRCPICGAARTPIFGPRGEISTSSQVFSHVCDNGHEITLEVRSGEK